MKKKIVNPIILFSGVVALVSTLGVCNLGYSKTKTKKSSVLNSLTYSEDGKNNDVKAVKTELLVSGAELKAIKQIKFLLKKYRGTPLEPDMMFRLAELYMRRAKSALFFEVNRDSSGDVNFSPKKIKGKKSTAYVKKAIKIYDRIRTRFKNYNEMDLVLFNEALACQQVSQEKKAESLFWNIIKKHGQSPLVPDAHLAIGEIAFKQKRFKFALKHFLSVKKFPDSRVFPYGIYKAAWTYYNLHDAASGMRELEAVVKYGVYVEKENIDSRLDLRKEALSDMAVFFEDVYTPDQGYSYFKKQAGNLPYSDYILKLGHIYNRHGAYKNLEIVYTEFISQDPYNVSIPSVRNEMVWNYENMKIRELALEQLVEFNKVCNDKNKWFKRNSSSMKLPEEKSALLKECENELDGTAIRLAQKWLRMWKKNSTHPIFAKVSEKAFEIYLEREKNSEEYRKARFVFAELLFQRKKFRKASLNYELAGRYFEKSKKNETLGHDARYAAILSLEKAVEKEKSKWKKADEDRFAHLVKTYAKLNPKGKYRLDVEFKMALISYEKGRYSVALPVFLRLGKQFSKTEKGLKSQDLYLDILNIKKDYTGLKNYAFGLLNEPGKIETKRKTKLTDIYEQSYFLEIQGLEELKQTAKAIQEYKKFALKNKNSKLATKAWINAMNMEYASGQLVAGAQSGLEYYKNFPGEKDNVSVLLKSASTYESIAQLVKATQILEILAKIDKGKKDYWSNLSADYNLLGENKAKAIKIYKQVVKSAKDGKQKLHALSQLAKIYDKEHAKPYSRQLHFSFLEQIAKLNIQPESGNAQIVLVEYLFLTNKYSEAFTAAKSLLNKKNLSIEAKSKARMLQAEILDDEFKKQSLKTSIDRLTLVIGLKTQKMDKAQRAYQSTIRIGNPEVSLKALLKLSDLYASYVHSLRTMPLPKDLPKSEEQSFRAEIENLAIPLEEKSIEAIAQAYSQSIQLELFDGQVEQIKKKLNQANLKNERLPAYKIELPHFELPQYVVGVKNEG